MIIILIGPMGSGKTTVGRLLAAGRGWTFADGDDYHPEANKKKMAAGIALDDTDREPWLLALRDLTQKHLSAGQPLILACSALKRKYRRMLGIDQQQICSVYLRGTPEILQDRIAARDHAFMDRGLLQSQLDTLEIPRTGLCVDIDTSPEAICRRIVHRLPIWAGREKPKDR
jgi:carbohydrate kinase (thermoresistant glucokinase family)